MEKLYNGDCLEIMKEIPDKSVDMLLTDPPYLHIKGGCKCKRLNRGVYSETNEIVNKMSDFNKEKIYEYLDAVKNKLSKINMYIFCSKLQIPYYLEWAVKNKFQFDVLIWDKMRRGLLGHKSFATNIEYIIRIYEYGCGLNEVKRNGKLVSEYYQKIQQIKNVHKKLNPAEKPIELLKRFILLSSKENDLVLDCFMGSGTTGTACKELNRDFIGIEIDDNYFKIAKERIEKACK